MGFLFDSILTDLLAFALAGLTLTYWWFTKQQNYWRSKGVPTARGPLPLIGNLWNMFTLKHNIGVFYQEMYNECKDSRYIGYYKLSEPALLIRDPELVKCVLVKDFKNFHDNAFEADNKKDPIFANHLTGLTGWKWKFIRTRITPAFTTGKIKHMFPLFMETCDDLVKYIEKYAVRPNECIDAKAMAAHYKIDVSALCAFGIKANSLNEEGSIFKSLGIGLLNGSRMKSVACLTIFLSPYLMRLLNLRLVPDGFGNFLKKIVADSMEMREKNNISRPDFVNMLMELKKKGNIEEEHDDDKYKLRSDNTEIYDYGDNKMEWTLNEFAGSALGFVGDSFETTSTTIGFALFEISYHPEVQKRLIQEVDEVLEKYDGKLVYQALSEMPYLEQVFCEILRKYPPIGIMMKRCNEDYKVPDSDLTIKKGTSVNIPIHALHNDPKYWPEPDKFDPERFSPENKRNNVPYTFIPFSDGPRTCVGNRFGQTQVKAALITVFKSYTVRPSNKTSYPIKMSPHFGVHPLEGLHVYFDRR